MFGLANTLSALPEVTCHTYFWSSWGDALSAINRQVSTDKTVLIGYSGGGSRATWLADQPSEPRIDLMILYDPSPTWQMYPITDNVRRAICYHNTMPLMFGLGGGVLLPVKGYNGYLETINVAEQHLAVQFDNSLHARTVAEVKQLA